MFWYGIQSEFYCDLLLCRAHGTPGCALWRSSQVPVCADWWAGERTPTRLESNEVVQASPAKARILVLDTYWQVTQSVLHVLVASESCDLLQCGAHGTPGCAFSALTLLVGRQEGHPAFEKLSGGVLAWLSVWSKVQTCIWPSWCHCHSLSLASVKSRLVLSFWYQLTQVVPGLRAV